MNIFLTILAVIGKLILLLLGLLLLVLLCILFSPFGYAVDAKKEEARLWGKVRLTYLFRILALEMSVEKNGHEALQKSMDIKIFGFSRNAHRQRREERKRKKQKAARQARLKKLKKEDPLRYAQLKEEARRRKEVRQIQREMQAKSAEEAVKTDERSEPEVVKAPEAPKAAAEVPNVQEEPKAKEPELPVQRPITEDKKPNEAKEAGPKPRRPKALFRQIFVYFGRFLTLVYQKLTDALLFPVRLMSSLFEKCQRYLAWKEKLSRLLAFLTDQRLWRAIRYSKLNLTRLLGHIKPRICTGHIDYSTEDPAYTGQILGVLSLFYPLYGSDFQINADFDADRWQASGEVTLRGRLYLFYLLLIGLRMLLHKDIRFVIHRIRHPEEEYEHD